MNKPNTVAGSILFTVAAGYGYMIVTLPNRNLPNTMGANFMPTIFDICLALLSLALIAQGIWRNTSREGGQAPVPLTVRNVLGIVAVFGIFFAYIFLINVIGFLVVTPLVLLALLLLQGIRRPIALIAVCLGVTAGVYVLFRYGFNVQIAGINLL